MDIVKVNEEKDLGVLIDCMQSFIYLLYWAVSTAGKCPGKKRKLQNYKACVKLLKESCKLFENVS